MTENPHDPQRILRHDDLRVGSRRARATRAIGWRGLMLPVALAAVTVAGCSSSAGSTAARATPERPASSTSTSAPTLPSTPMQTSAPDSTPTVTVTVTPPPTPTVVVQSAASGPFRSPSGNINCTMFTSAGQNIARCEVIDHTWAAPPRSTDCHLNWGDRFELTEGSAATFNCYGQEFPTPEQTLAYGQTRSLGTITCDSEYTGMTCTDSSTGHYFRVAREIYQLG